MAVYVTGANGFIGSHLTERLLRDGEDVVALVRPTSDLRNLAAIPTDLRARLRIVHGDLRDPSTLGPGLESATVIYHLAAVLMGTSERAFQELIVDGTRNLLDAIPANAPLTRFLHVSSLAAAGPSATATPPKDETAPTDPVSWYGRAKADAERLVNERASAGLLATIVRPSAVYGEREIEISGSAFGAVRLGLLPQVGFGQRRATFVYVGDLVDGIVAAAASPGSVGKTYFLTDVDGYETQDVMRAVADVMGTRIRIPVSIPHAPMFLAAVGSEWLHLFTRSRPALTRDKWREVGQRFWTCTPAAAEADFGWRPAHDLRRGLTKAVADWQQRREDARTMRGEPNGDRARKTYAVALGFGLTLEGLAQLGGFYHFTPWWVLIVVVVGVYMGVMGTVAFLLARASMLVQFLVGATIGIGAEFLNVHVLHAWEFTEKTTSVLPDPTVRAILLGLPAGLMPVLVNVILRQLYAHRRRMG